MLGKLNDESFSCYAKSGGQNLWLPFKKDVGLKIFHPKGFSGSLDKARTYYKAQTLLAEKRLSPQPLELYEIDLNFVKALAVLSPWRCYGIMMERVLSGGVSQILRNLELFGVESNQQSRIIVKYWLSWSGLDALTLAEYIILCRFFGVSEEKYLKEIIDDLKNKIPSVFSKAPDLLSWSNVVLDENGEAKVIDCDLSGI